MNIFYKRPLSLILCIWLGAFVLSANLAYQNCIMLTIAALSLAVLTFLPLKLFGERKTFVRILALGLMVIIAYSAIYFGLYMKADERFSDKTVTISGTVEKIDISKSPYYDYVIIKSKSVNNKPLSRYTFNAYLDKEESTALTTGTPLTVTCKIEKPFTYAHSFNGTLTEIEDLTVTGKPSLNFNQRLSAFREKSTRAITFSCGNTDAGGFLAALLLGEDAYLSPILESDFTRMGISHILALSGMHLAIISAAVNLILSFFGIGKKLRTLITAILTLLYMFLTGFSASVTRAGIMLILASILFLFMGAKDSVTSLSVAAFSICFFDPMSIYDIGLWLSVFATLGVIVAYEICSEYIKDKCVIYRIFRYVIVSLISSLFAIAATMLISNLTFGRISIISPITTLIFGLLSEAYIYSGVFSILLGYIIKNPIISIMYSCIESLAAVFSDIKYVYVFTDFNIVKILTFLTTLALIIFLIFDVKHKRLSALFICCLTVSVFLSAFLCTISALNENKLIYYSEENQDSFASISDKQVMFIDSQTYSVTSYTDPISKLENLHISEVNHYVITGYYKRLPAMLERLFLTTKVHNLHLPSPLNDDENDILAQVQTVCKANRIKLEVSAFDEPIGSATASFYYVFRTAYGESAQKYIYTIKADGEFHTFLSSGILEGFTRKEAEKVLLGSRVIIFGNHGKKYSDTIAFNYEIPNLDLVVINSDKMHMNDKYVKYYSDQNTKVCTQKDKIILK